MKMVIILFGIYLLGTIIFAKIINWWEINNTNCSSNFLYQVCCYFLELLRGCLLIHVSIGWLVCLVGPLFYLFSLIFSSVGATLLFFKTIGKFTQTNFSWILTKENGENIEKTSFVGTEEEASAYLYEEIKKTITLHEQRKLKIQGTLYPRLIKIIKDNINDCIIGFTGTLKSKNGLFLYKIEKGKLLNN